MVGLVRYILTDDAEIVSKALRLTGTKVNSTAVDTLVMSSNILSKYLRKESEKTAAAWNETRRETHTKNDSFFSENNRNKNEKKMSWSTFCRFSPVSGRVGRYGNWEKFALFALEVVWGGAFLFWLILSAHAGHEKATPKSEDFCRINCVSTTDLGGHLSQGTAKQEMVKKTEVLCY